MFRLKFSMIESVWFFSNLLSKVHLMNRRPLPFSTPLSIPSRARYISTILFWKSIIRGCLLGAALLPVLIIFFVWRATYTWYSVYTYSPPLNRNFAPRGTVRWLWQIRTFYGKRETTFIRVVGRESVNPLFLRPSWLKSLYTVYYPDLSRKSHDTHKFLERKMPLGLIAFYILTSINFKCHISNVMTRWWSGYHARLVLRGDPDSNPARDTNFSFISETCVESHW